MTKQALPIAIAAAALVGLTSSALATEKTAANAFTNSNLALYGASSTAFPSGTVQQVDDDPPPPPPPECFAFGC